jgi:hypothetical protein
MPVQCGRRSLIGSLSQDIDGAFELSRTEKLDQRECTRLSRPSPVLFDRDNAIVSFI